MDYTEQYDPSAAKQQAMQERMYKKAAMQQAATDVCRNARSTPIHEAVERMRNMCVAADELAYRLERQADTVFGVAPQACGEGLGAGPVHAEPPLIDLLLNAVSDLERAQSRLAEATGRNCWAI